MKDIQYVKVKRELLSKWIAIACDCIDTVEEFAERYPSEYGKLLEQYNQMIDEMYNANKPSTNSQPKE